MSKEINTYNFIDYIVEHKNSVQIISNLINSYNHLLKTISMMVGKKVFHGDLKGTNILFDIERQAPILIDFGLSVNIDSITERNIKNVAYGLNRFETSPAHVSDDRNMCCSKPYEIGSISIANTLSSFRC